MTFKDIEVAPASTEPGTVTSIDLHMVTSDVNNITPEMGEDLVNLIARALQTVAHIVMHADFSVYIESGATVNYSFDIVPASVGEEFPPSA